MRWLREHGIRIGSTTGYTRAMMDALEPLAREAGIAPEMVICADEVRQGRPAPWACFRIARRSADRFVQLACVAITVWLIGQATLNMGYVVGLLPVTGVTLPLISAGGTSLVLTLFIVGLLARFTSLIELNPPYCVLAHPVVLVVLAVLAVLDFVADKIPALDHVLHVVGLVIHPIAGAIVFLAASSDVGSVHPVLAAVCGIVLAGGSCAVHHPLRL